MSQKLSPADRVSAARIRMLERSPFHGLLAMRLTLKADAKAADVWVDGKTLGYNPQWVDGASFDELMSAVAHGAHHIALLHHLRRCGRDDATWQKACDVPVHHALKQQDFVLPKGVYLDPLSREKSAEDIYSEIARNDRDGPEGFPTPGNDQGDGEGQNGESGDDQSGDPGAGPGEVKDQPGKNGGSMDEAEQQQAAAEALQDIAAAAQQAKNAGNLPADIARQLQELLYPSADWRDLLRDYLRSVGKADYSWARPNRRFISRGLYLPSLHSESEMGEMVIAVDTSGSIDDHKLQAFGGALNELLEELNPRKVTVIYCDTQIQRVDEFDADSYPIQFSPVGGGGTRLYPPFQYVESEGLDPAVFLYFTDLCGRRPNRAPDYPVLWLDQDASNRHLLDEKLYGASFGHYIALK